MFKRLTFASILFFVFFLSGCASYMMGENVVFVEGDANEKCVVMVMPEGGDRNHRFYYHDVLGTFSYDVVISPKSQLYIVEVKCADKLVLTNTFLYPNDGNIIDIGSV